MPSAGTTPASATDDARGRRIALVLLAATFINYANRVVVTQNAAPIRAEFQASNEDYGAINSWFGLGFAFGGLTFGMLADVVPVRLMYPAVVLIWSACGAASGLAPNLKWLTTLQFLLGFFEAGHWPCALRTTQRLFAPAERVLGNSVLQSGAALGAVATPLLILALLKYDPAHWRIAFFVAGGLGVPWIVWWLRSVRDDDLRRPVLQTDETAAAAGRELRDVPFFSIFVMPRWWTLFALVLAINTVWHYIRVWMPLMLEEDRGYSRPFVQGFSSVYYLSTFFGSLASGASTRLLVERGWNVHRARSAAFLGFSLMTALCVPAAFVPASPLLLGLLLVIAFGSLGLFPVYYSLNQEISAKHQGKVGGILGFSAWSILYFVHKGVGRAVDADPGIRPWIFAAAGLLPLAGWIVLWLAWGRTRPESDERIANARE